MVEQSPLLCGWSRFRPSKTTTVTPRSNDLLIETYCVHFFWCGSTIFWCYFGTSIIIIIIIINVQNMARRMGSYEKEISTRIFQSTKGKRMIEFCKQRLRIFLVGIMPCKPSGILLKVEERTETGKTFQRQHYDTLDSRGFSGIDETGDALATDN